MQKAPDTSGDNFQITIGLKSCTDRAEALEAMKNAARRNNGNDFQTIGEFKGMPLAAKMVWNEGRGAEEQLRLGKTITPSAGTILSLEHWAKPDTQQGKIDRINSQVADMKANAEKAAAASGKSFPKADLLKQKRGELEQLLAKMANHGKDHQNQLDRTTGESDDKGNGRPDHTAQGEDLPSPPTGDDRPAGRPSAHRTGEEPATWDEVHRSLGQAAPRRSQVVQIEPGHARITFPNGETVNVRHESPADMPQVQRNEAIASIIDHNHGEIYTDGIHSVRVPESEAEFEALPPADQHLILSHDRWAAVYDHATKTIHISNALPLSEVLETLHEEIGHHAFTRMKRSDQGKVWQFFKQKGSAQLGPKRLPSSWQQTCQRTSGR